MWNGENRGRDTNYVEAAVIILIIVPAVAIAAYTMYRGGLLPIFAGTGKPVAEASEKRQLEHYKVGTLVDIYPWHDDRRGVTCWIFEGYSEGGISCLPDPKPEEVKKNY